ncbi:MAG: glycosyltransferase [Lachnospiraceae bacterium]|nr:glycosyltransferase [Lachnospiraceae bacterium]
MNKTRFSVITVCLNAEKEIEYTINSVLNQDDTDYEYLIKDGQSNDATIEIAEKYRDRFREKNISFRIISEKDEGLYDAMNRSAEYANGEWIMYLNAGDALFDEHVLTRLSSEVSGKYDVIYGNTVLLENGKYKLLKAGETSCFKNYNPICHQSSITRTEIVRKYLFDAKYEIAADFDLFIKIFSADEKSFRKLDDTLCIYRLGGVSSNRVLKREKEFDASRRSNGLKRVAFPHLQITRVVLIEGTRKLAKKILGKNFYSEKRGWYPEKYKAAQWRKID